ncbi:Lipopolysaccharide-modifying protein [Cordyceps fumosorosea ARSEF 2679]|uniref:Lipopolysaccharide-modifying protein n=1 Tax=Cordyceps fumosorosea (strain ARSEF 2679) TaxID=1081104 RepID=A0A167SZL8_CORFA|nr:Lipopolysaccharide-modifying protein [Cordyceps fumosorosea ARSEF 2679]OAA60094.1 Lipopolysaccharide-modifying protein [Cordyceps fumosorosea ARSEF 2679]
MPFWGLAPRTVRKRAAEALRSGDSLMRVVVRDGKVTDVEGGPKWMQDAMRGMMEKFVQYLPSMEIAFNTIDEPRVVVPHDDLERFLARALTKNMLAASSNRSPINSFSSHSTKSKENTDTNMNTISFTQIGRSPSWQHLRLGCRPDSPAGALADADSEDDVKSYGQGELGFIYNTSTMSDVCLSPSLRASHGFFDRPDTHSISYDLLPIFSQSKTSVNNDILYPSLWYWVDMVHYDATSDVPWSKKQDRLYWRGSTTGGFATGGNWKGHHRQRFVDMMSGNGSATVLSRRGDDHAAGGWAVETVERGEYRDLVDVAFTKVVQCDEADCAAQTAHFDVQARASQQDGWHSRMVLDMDGNAFSGRFYALLRSRSLTLKFASFREWHAEWLRPWVHYAPLSLQGREWLELVRYFSDGDGGGGAAEAEGMAARSTDWAERVLRKEDMEAWFFRLLLEYGRIIDDQRAYIGFTFSGANVKR